MSNIETTTWTKGSETPDATIEEGAVRWTVTSSKPCSQCSQNDGKLFASEPSTHGYCSCQFTSESITGTHRSRTKSGETTEEEREYAGWAPEGQTRKFDTPNGSVTVQGGTYRNWFYGTHHDEYYYVYDVTTTTYIDLYDLPEAISGDKTITRDAEKVVKVFKGLEKESYSIGD